MPGWTGSTSRWTPSTATASCRSPAATGSPTCSKGLAAAEAAGLAPVKVNAVLMRGVNDDEAVPLLRWALRAGYQLRFIEQMPLDAQHGWTRDRHGHRRRDPRPPGRGVRAGTGRCRRPRQRAGRGVAGRRRPGPGRRHRLGDAAVLRGLRPGAAHRRRSAAQLPVRPRGVRPAGRRCAPARPTTTSPPGCAPPCWRSGPGTASTTPVSCSRCARCPRSAADPASFHSASVCVSRRKPRASRNSLSGPLCSSQAVHVLRRSGVCSLGLFHASTQTASARQPFAEHTGDVVSRLGPPVTRTPRKAMPGSHGGSRPASRSRRRRGRPRSAVAGVLHGSMSSQAPDRSIAFRSSARSDSARSTTRSRPPLANTTDR